MLLLKVSCSLHTHVHVQCVTETVYFLKADGRVKFRVEHEFEVNCFNLIFFKITLKYKIDHSISEFVGWSVGQSNKQ